MLLPKFRLKGLTPEAEARRDERTLNRLRRILRGRLASVRSQLSVTELVGAIDATEDDGLARPEGYERVALEDRTLLGGVPSEFVFHLALSQSMEYPDPETLMLVAEKAPLYSGDYIEDLAEDGAE